jgi:hypothetical protein
VQWGKISTAFAEAGVSMRIPVTADGLLAAGLARADLSAFLGCLPGRRDFTLLVAGDLRIERIVSL